MTANQADGAAARWGRRQVLLGAAAIGTAAALAPAPAAAEPQGRSAGIVKPLPAEHFTVHGTNAEAHWSSARGTGLHTPNEWFFVRNHTATPRIDADRWRLTVWGDGLDGPPLTVGLADLRRLPVYEQTALIECAGNGRDHFRTQQGQDVSGTPWGLGAIGAARWRGARLGDLLRRARVRPGAVDVQPRGLDAEFHADGVNLGRVRRPIPVAKAMDDVLLAYGMNGAPLPPDHGFPVRVVVPSWVGIASVKWVGDIEVSERPLRSPWNTDLYRLFGPGFPDEGSAPLTRQSVKSAFEDAPDAVLAAGRPHRITGRSWSGAGTVRSVEVSTDGGRTWGPVRFRDGPADHGWRRWSVEWTPRHRGPATLRARATDSAGRRQPDRAVFNEQGYLFDAVVHHPVTVR